MKISICITTHNKLDILKQTLEDLKSKSFYPFELIISDDCSDQETIKYLEEEVPKMFKAITSDIKILLSSVNKGCAESLEKSFLNATGDYLIHMDPDLLMEPKDWYYKLAQLLEDHPEAGIAAPEYPNHHLRLHRDGYDEVGYCMGGVWAIRRELVNRLRRFMGNGIWDKDLFMGQWEVDMCYRARMLGYRVAMLKGITWTHLDPNPNWVGYRGVVEFFHKWNMYLLGFFHYKSPAMITWDEFPLNKLLRRQIFYQEGGLNHNPAHKMVQNHKCELMPEMRAPETYLREKELFNLVKQNKVFRGCDEFENIPDELVKGKIKWSIDIEKDLEEKRRK